MFRIFLDYIQQLAAAEGTNASQNALKIIAECYELPLPSMPEMHDVSACAALGDG